MAFKTEQMCYGFALDTDPALRAWKRATAMLQKLAVSLAGMIMHYYRNPVYTSDGWTTQLLVGDRLRFSYALIVAKDNPEMEYFNGHFKTEGFSLFWKARTITDLIQIVDERMTYYS